MFCLFLIFFFFNFSSIFSIWKNRYFESTSNSPIKINSNYSVFSPKIGESLDGSFLVLWRSSNLFFALFDKIGNKKSDIFQLPLSNLTVDFSITSKFQEQFVITWISNDTFSFFVSKYQFNDINAFKTIRFFENNTEDSILSISISDFYAGQYILAWVFRNLNNTYGLVLTFLDSELNRIRNDILFRSSKLGIENLVIKNLKNGRFVIAWSEFFYILGGVFNSSGISLKIDDKNYFVFGINDEFSSAYNFYPSIAIGLSSNDFIIIWLFTKNDYRISRRKFIYNEKEDKYFQFNNSFKFSDIIVSRLIGAQISGNIDDSYIIVWSSQFAPSSLIQAQRFDKDGEFYESNFVAIDGASLFNEVSVNLGSKNRFIIAASAFDGGSNIQNSLMIKVFPNVDYHFSGQIITTNIINFNNVDLHSEIYSFNNNYLIIIYDSIQNCFICNKYDETDNVLFNNLTYFLKNKNSTVLSFQAEFNKDESFIIIWQTKQETKGIIYNSSFNLFDEEFLILNKANFSFKICFTTGIIVIAWNSSFSSVQVSLLWIDLQGKLIKPEYNITLRERLLDSSIIKNILIYSILGYGFKILCIPYLESIYINVFIIDIFSNITIKEIKFDVLFVSIDEIYAINWNNTFVQCVNWSSKCSLKYQGGNIGRTILVDFNKNNLNFVMGTDESFIIGWIENKKQIIWKKCNKIENQFLKNEKIIYVKRLSITGKTLSGIDSIFTNNGKKIWTLNLNEFNIGILLISEFIEESSTFYIIKEIVLPIINPNKLNIYKNCIYITNSSFYFIFVDITNINVLSNFIHFNHTSPFIYFYDSFFFLYNSGKLLIYKLEIDFPYNFNIYNSISINYKILNIQITNNKCFLLSENFLILFDIERLFQINLTLSFNLKLETEFHNNICKEITYNFTCIFINNLPNNVNFIVDSTGKYIFIPTLDGLNIISFISDKFSINVKNIGFGSDVLINYLDISNNNNYLSLSSEFSIYLLNIENPINPYISEQLTYSFKPKKAVFNNNNNYIFVNGINCEIILLLKFDLTKILPSLSFINQPPMINYENIDKSNFQLVHETYTLWDSYMGVLLTLVYKTKYNDNLGIYIKINVNIEKEGEKFYIQNYFISNKYLLILFHNSTLQNQFQLFNLSSIKNNTLNPEKSFIIENCLSFISFSNDSLLFLFIKNKGIDVYEYDFEYKTSTIKLKYSLKMIDFLKYFSNLIPSKMIFIDEESKILVIFQRNNFYILIVINIQQTDVSNEEFYSEFLVESHIKLEYLKIKNNSYFLVLGNNLNIYQIKYSEKLVSFKTNFFNKIPIKIDDFTIINSEYMIIETYKDESISEFTTILINNFDYPIIIHQKSIAIIKRLFQSTIYKDKDNDKIFILTNYGELYGLYENEIDIITDISSLNLGQQKQFIINIIPLNTKSQSRTNKQIKINKIEFQNKIPLWVNINLNEKIIVITPPSYNALLQLLDQKIMITFSLKIDEQIFTTNEYQNLKFEGYIDSEGFLTEKISNSNTIFAKLSSYLFKKVIILKHEDFLKINNKPIVIKSLVEQFKNSLISEKSNLNITSNIIKVGHPLNFQIESNSIEDKDNDYLIYTTSILPVWLNFDSSLLSLKGTPSKADQGFYNISLTVSDDYYSFTEFFNFEVKAYGPKIIFPLNLQLKTISNYNPEIDKISYLSFDSRTFVDENGEGIETLTYSASLSNDETIPVWIKVDSNFPTFSFSPTIYELYKSYKIKLICTNKIGENNYDVFEIYVIASWYYIFKYLISILSGIIFIFGLVKYSPFLYETFCVKHYLYTIPIEGQVNSLFEKDIFLIRNELDLSHSIWNFIINKENSKKKKVNWEDWLDNDKLINSIEEAIIKLNFKNQIAKSSLETNGILITIVESFLIRKILNSNFYINKAFKKLKKDFKKRYLKSWIEFFVKYEKNEIIGSRVDKFPKIIFNKIFIDDIIKNIVSEMITKENKTCLRRNFCCCKKKMKPILFDDRYYKIISGIVRAEALGIPKYSKNSLHFLDSTKGISIFVLNSEIGLITSYKKEKQNGSFFNFKKILGLDKYRNKITCLPNWINITLGTNYLRLYGNVPEYEENGDTIWIQINSQRGILLREFKILINKREIDGEDLIFNNSKKFIQPDLKKVIDFSINNNSKLGTQQHLKDEEM